MPAYLHVHGANPHIGRLRDARIGWDTDMSAGSAVGVEVLAGEGSALIPAVLLALLLAVTAHDLVRLRRLHRATAYGVGAIVVGVITQRLNGRLPVHLRMLHGRASPRLETTG